GHQPQRRKTLSYFKAQTPRFPEFVVWPVSKAQIILGEVPTKPVLPAPPPTGSPFAQSTFGSTKTSGGGGRRPEGHRPSSPSPREKQGKAPRLDRASEGSASPAWDGERGPSPAWSPLAPPPPELRSNSWPGGRRGL
ncbi:hypothetical protein EI555_016116, partial [Monodon monoceros]